MESGNIKTPISYGNRCVNTWTVSYDSIRGKNEGLKHIKLVRTLPGHWAIPFSMI